MGACELKELANKKTVDAVIEKIKSYRKVKTDIWNDLFASLLSDPSGFKDSIGRFVKNRNHVAHNKLLTWAVYQTIITEIGELRKAIADAMNRFETTYASDEQSLSDEMIEDENIEQDEEAYWRERVTEETGVDIRSEDEIIALFSERVYELFNAVFDHFHFASGFEITDLTEPCEEGTWELFSITSNASERDLAFGCSITVDESMDSDSEMTVYAEIEGERVKETTISYHNGAGCEGEDGVCYPTCDSEINDEDWQEFVEEVEDYIENELNPYVRLLEEKQYAAVMEGAEECVADFPCYECGKNGISIDDSFFQVGKCCLCGAENEVKFCKKCGRAFDPEMGEDENLCNACIPKD